MGDAGNGGGCVGGGEGWCMGNLCTFSQFCYKPNTAKEKVFKKSLKSEKWGLEEEKKLSYSLNRKRKTLNVNSGCTEYLLLLTLSDLVVSGPSETLVENLTGLI